MRLWLRLLRFSELFGSARVPWPAPPSDCSAANSASALHGGGAVGHRSEIRENGLFACAPRTCECCAPPAGWCAAVCKSGHLGGDASAVAVRLGGNAGGGACLRSCRSAAASPPPGVLPSQTRFMRRVSTISLDVPPRYPPSRRFAPLHPPLRSRVRRHQHVCPSSQDGPAVPPSVSLLSHVSSRLVSLPAGSTQQLVGSLAFGTSVNPSSTKLVKQSRRQ